MKLANEKGFSLVELLIVVVVIGILAAIAIPNLLATRRAANEASVLSALRTIHSCEVTYFSTVGNGDYTDLPTLAVYTLTDQVLGSGTKSGYRYVVTPTSTGVRPSLFYATAVPVTPSGPAQTGTRRFGMTEDGVLHGDSTLLTPYTDHADVRSAPALAN
jgi:prepilin-type N-terminal cleavage/methylation domain-containing protein